MAALKAFLSGRYASMDMPNIRNVWAKALRNRTNWRNAWLEAYGLSYLMNINIELA
jgi:hypothetical protein